MNFRLFLFILECRFGEIEQLEKKRARLERNRTPKNKTTEWKSREEEYYDNGKFEMRNAFGGNADQK